MHQGRWQWLCFDYKVECLSRVKVNTRVEVVESGRQLAEQSFRYQMNPFVITTFIMVAVQHTHVRRKSTPQYLYRSRHPHAFRRTSALADGLLRLSANSIRGESSILGGDQQEIS